MAIGRTPNTQGMGLEAAGVVLDKDRFIVVNEFMQTSNPDIYAAGDVTPGPNLVYVAAAGGGIAATIDRCPACPGGARGARAYQADCR